MGFGIRKVIKALALLLALWLLIRFAMPLMLPFLLGGLLALAA